MARREATRSSALVFAIFSPKCVIHPVLPKKFATLKLIVKPAFPHSEAITSQTDNSKDMAATLQQTLVQSFEQALPAPPQIDRPYKSSGVLLQASMQTQYKE